MGPQFGPEELFDLLGALGFARCQWKSWVASYGPRFGYDPRQNRANRRTMLLSHDAARGDMRLVGPYQVESEFEPAFPGRAGIDADQDVLQNHFFLPTGSQRKRQKFARRSIFRSLMIRRAHDSFGA